MATAQVSCTPEDTAHPGRLTPTPQAVPTARAEPGDPDGALDPVRLTYPREQSGLVGDDQYDAHQPADLAVEGPKVVAP